MTNMTILYDGSKRRIRVSLREWAPQPISVCWVERLSLSSSPWQSEMELPLTFKDSSGKVIIELHPAVFSQEMGKWHMGPGTKQRERERHSQAREREGGKQREKVNDHPGILAGDKIHAVDVEGKRKTDTEREREREREEEKHRALWLFQWRTPLSCNVLPRFMRHRDAFQIKT